MNWMNHTVSVRPMLDMLSQGNLMRSVMGRLTQVMAVLIGLSLLMTWVSQWSMLQTLGTWPMLAMAVAQIFLLVAFAKMVQVIWCRGEDIMKLPESDFTMMPILASFVRLPGEVGLAFFALFSIPAMLLVWSGAAPLLAELMIAGPWWYAFATMLFGTAIWGGNVFLAGLATFATCWVFGLALLVMFTLAGELVSAMHSMAHDLRCTRRSLEGGPKSHTMSSHTSHARAA
jgi:hypothetical protein